MNNKTIQLTKIESAKRQLETAVRLFFLDEDPVSIHTLGNAANDIIKDIAESFNKKTIHTELLKLIKPERKDAVLKIVNKAKHFFKHANQNPSEQLTFYPASNEYLIFIAIQAFSELSGNPTPTMMAYRAYFYLKNPELLLKNNDIEFWKKFSVSFDLNDKKQFIKVIEIIEERHNF